MCRLAIFGGLEFGPLARGLDQLEKSLGGDGNGYFRTDEGIVKSLDLVTGEVAFAAHGSDRPTYFHTRLATAGGITDTLCHPFDAGSEGVLLHNGHWHNYDLHSRKGERSDTQSAARLVAEHGAGILMSRSFGYSGIFIVANEDGALVFANGGDFYFQWPESGGFFHASEPIKGIPMREMRVVLTGEVYFVDQSGNVSVVTHEILPVRMPKAKRTRKKIKSKKSKKNFKTFSGSTEDSGYWERLAEVEEMEHIDAHSEKDELDEIVEVYGYDSLTDWEQERLEELDKQLDDDEFFRNIKPTSWDA